MSAPTSPDRWIRLRRLTAARIALDRTGSSLSTREVLAFGLDHARARDAVHAAFDPAAVAAQIEALGFSSLDVTSAAPDRAVYLRRPDLGRTLSPTSAAMLQASGGGVDLAIIMADGLSSAAVHAHAAPLLAALKPHIAAAGWSTGPVVLAHQARVALGDEIGARLGARMAAVLIGERPGLSSPDSLGGLSHIRPAARPDGCGAQLHLQHPPRRLGLRPGRLQAGLARNRGAAPGAVGVGLKDESDLAFLSNAAGPPQVSL